MSARSRKKLGDTENDEHIKTVRGVGYIFALPREKDEGLASRAGNRNLMKSLFVRIFPFLLVGAGIVLRARDSGDAGVPPRARPGKLAHHRAERCRERVRRGRGDSLRKYLDEVEESQHVRAFLFNENMEEVAAGARRIGRYVLLREAAITARRIPVSRSSDAAGFQASSDGKHRYTLVMGLPPGPRVFIGPQGVPLHRSDHRGHHLGAGVLSACVVFDQADCPVANGGAQIAAGDLTARTGAPRASGGTKWQD